MANYSTNAKNIKKSSRGKRNLRPKISTKRKYIENDIIELILQDHRSLKHLIRLLKNNRKDLEKRIEALEKFTPLLLSHARAEEGTVYRAIKKHKDFAEESFEGEIEHGLADLMLEMTQNTDNKQRWSARAKVLAEIVEHHLKVEETTMLVHFKNLFPVETRQNLGFKYLSLKQSFLKTDPEVEIIPLLETEMPSQPTH